MNLLGKQIQSYRLREGTCGYWKEGWEEGTVRESGMDMDTLLYLTWRTSKDLLDSTGNSAQYSVITLWSPGGRMGKGESGSLAWTWTHCCIYHGEPARNCWTAQGTLLDAGEFGGEGVHVYVWLSPFAVHQKLSQHC